MAMVKLYMFCGYGQYLYVLWPWSICMFYGYGQFLYYGHGQFVLFYGYGQFVLFYGHGQFVYILCPGI